MKVFRISLRNGSSSVVVAETKDDAIKMFSDGYRCLYDTSPNIQDRDINEVDTSKAKIVAFNR